MLVLGSFYWPTTAGTTPIPPAPPGPYDPWGFGYTPSGGKPEKYPLRPLQEFKTPYSRGKTDEDVRKERERLGIIDPIEVIHRVAERQVETLSHDAQQHLEELERELELQGIQWEGRYLEILNVKRQKLIDEEIGVRIRLRIGLRLRQLQIEEEEISIALLLMTL